MPEKIEKIKFVFNFGPLFEGVLFVMISCQMVNSVYIDPSVKTHCLQ